jgi:hypothetical protein
MKRLRLAQVTARFRNLPRMGTGCRLTSARDPRAEATSSGG